MEYVKSVICFAICLSLSELVTSQVVFTSETTLDELIVPVKYEGVCVDGGVLQTNITTQLDCESVCRRTTSCKGFDFTTSLTENKCVFHSHVTVCDNAVATTDCTHYTFVGCVSCQTTTAGNSRDNCVFPFIYRNSVYTECTSFDYPSPWCATTLSYDADKKFGVCEDIELCPASTTTTTTTTTTSASTTSPPIDVSTSTTTEASTTTTTMSTSTSTTTMSSPSIPSTTEPRTSRDPTRCFTYFNETRGVFSYGGIQQPFEGEACKRQCMAQDIPMKCLGLDYNLALDKCYFHYDERDLLSTFPGEETNHYEKVTECPLSTTAPSSECVDSFEVSENEHKFDGERRDGITVLDSCKFACLRNPMCLGLDFNFLEPGCYFFTEQEIIDAPSFSRNMTNHYKRIPCKSTTVTEPSSTTPMSTTPGCEDTFNELSGFFALGGKPLKEVKTVEECREVCRSVPDCFSVDFDKNNSDSMCFWHDKPENQLDFQTPSEAGILISHYIRIDCTLVTQDPGEIRSSVTRGGCIDRFEQKSSYGSFGGDGQPDSNDVRTCRQFCLFDSDCKAFDFDPSNRGDKCYLHVNRSMEYLQQQRYESIFVNQFIRIPCSINVTSPMPNVTTTVDPMTSDMVSTACEDTFFPEQNTDAGQGIPQPAAVNSLEMCREVCLGRLDCTGYSYNRRQGTRCMLHNMISIIERRPRDGVDLFTRVPCTLLSTTKRVPPSGTTGCVDTFNVSRNTMRYEGDEQDAETAFACGQMCLSTQSCMSFDFNVIENTCFFFYSQDDPRDMDMRIGINHHVRVPCVTATPPTVATTTDDGECRERYNVSRDTFSYGGAPFPFITDVAACAAICSNNATCLGFDFVYESTNGDDDLCYIHTNATLFKQIINGTRGEGSNQHIRVRCVNDTTTTSAMTSTSTTMMPSTSTSGPNFCDSFPCLNGASCFPTEDMSFRCECMGGFTGDRCGDRCEGNNDDFLEGFNFWMDCMKLTVDILGEAMMQNNEDAMEACRESGGALVMIDTLEMQKMLVLALNTTANTTGRKFPTGTEIAVAGRTSLTGMINIPNFEVGSTGPYCLVLSNVESPMFQLYSQDCEKETKKIRLCKKVDGCPMPEVPENGEIDVMSSMVGGVAQVSCEDWYVLSEGNGTLYCEDDNLWSHEVPQCVRSEGNCPSGEPMDDMFCGEGEDHKDCPDGYSCNIEDDKYAVCCPDDPTTTSTSMSTTMSTEIVTETCREVFQKTVNIEYTGGLPITDIHEEEECIEKCQGYVPKCWGLEFMVVAGMRFSCFIHLSIFNFVSDNSQLKQGNINYRRLTVCGEIPDTTPSAECVGTYDPFISRYPANGSPIFTINSLGECQKFCERTTACTGILYTDGIVREYKCYIYTSTVVNTLYVEGVTFYRLLSRCDGTILSTAPSPTGTPISGPCTSQPCRNGATCNRVSADSNLFTCSCRTGFEGEFCEKTIVVCEDSFNRFMRVNSPYGNPEGNAFTSVESCQQSCKDKPTCLGLDYSMVPTDIYRCYLHSNKVYFAIKIDNDGQAEQYVINRCDQSAGICPDGSSPAGSCGGVVGAQCGASLSCLYPSSSTLGICCDQSAGICPDGSSPAGSCGGVVGAQCGASLSCLYPSSSTLGICCGESSVNTSPSTSTTTTDQIIAGSGCTFAVLPFANSDSGVPQNLNTAGVCFNACQGNTSCVAADYNMDQGACYFHTSATIVGMMLKNCCRRFIRSCTTCNPNEFWESSQRRGSNPSVSISSSSAIGCQGECLRRSNPACEAVAYNSATNSCLLYSSVRVQQAIEFTEDANFNFYQRYRCVNNINDVPYI